MALELNPEFPEACYNLGNAFVGQARFREAKAQYRNALTLKPDWVVAYNQLARLSAACRDAAIRNGVEAVALAQQAVTLSGGRVPTILDTLAAAYAEAGRFPEAIRTAQRAADLAAQQNDAALVEAIKSHLRLYEAGTPLRGM
jgi:tetratricopeptide (TPR) repeat protein